MKRLSPTRILCELSLAPHLSTLPQTNPLSYLLHLGLPTTSSFPANSSSAHTHGCPALRHGLGTPQHRSFPPLNLHKAASAATTGGFLHVAVSKARLHYLPLCTSCPLALPIQP